MTPQFSSRQIEQQIMDFAATSERKFIQALQYIGEEFVNRARSINTYENQTGNLRSSIGYAIAKDGRVIGHNYKEVDDGNEGIVKGMDLAESTASEHPNGIILIVTAGMQYALYVEAMGYDVLSGSIPNRQSVIDSFIQMIPR